MAAKFRTGGLWAEGKSGILESAEGFHAAENRGAEGFAG